MRIIILVLLIAVLYPTGAYGQINEYGIKIGAQSTSVFSDPSVDNRIIGFSGYIFVDRQLNESLFTNIDLGFTQRGFRNASNEINEDGEFIQRVEATSRLYYLSLSPSLNLALPVISSNAYVGLGPRLDLLIDTQPGEYEFTNVTVSEDIVNDFDDLAFGASFVAGFKKIPIGGLSVRVEAKYEVDITDSLSNHPREFRNNAIMVVLGVGF